MATTVREYDATALMQFACGFDSLSGNVTGTAVTGMPGEFVGGDATEFSLFKVESIEDFLSTLEISASASVQAAFGKVGPRPNTSAKLRPTTTHSMWPPW